MPSLYRCSSVALCGLFFLLASSGCDDVSSAKPAKDKVVENKTVPLPVQNRDADVTPLTDGPGTKPVEDSSTPSTAETALSAKAITDTPKTVKPNADKPNANQKPTNEGITDKVLLGSPDLTAGISGEGDLTLDQIKAWLDNPRNHLTLEIELPLGLSAAAGQEKGLKENPLTRAKIELGRQLFFDPRLSGDGSISCASCHHPDNGYAKDTQFGVGVKSQTGNRNSPVAYNRILSDKQFWDGRADSLEDQAVGPIANAIEMSNTHEACVTCLKAIEGYRVQFERVFGELSVDTIGKALASFERALVTSPAPFDFHEQFRPFAQLDVEDLEDAPEQLARYKAAKEGVEKFPMNDGAKRGRDLFFGKANCTACHVGANLTDEKFHNLGVGMMAAEPDQGRFTVTKDPKDTGAFKTPTVRNVALTAPYMHDGSQKTLAEVVEWYAKGGHPNSTLSDKVKKLDLNDQDKQDLVAFMEACTGELPKVERGRLPPK